MFRRWYSALLLSRISASTLWAASRSSGTWYVPLHPAASGGTCWRHNHSLTRPPSPAHSLTHSLTNSPHRRKYQDKPLAARTGK
jgi:hypothetical protein